MKDYEEMAMHKGKKDRERMIIRRKQLFEAAQVEFNNGFDSIRMQSIADRSGLTIRYVYIEFYSKEYFYVKCYFHFGKEVILKMRKSIVDCYDVEERMCKMIRAYFLYVFTKGGVRLLFAGDANFVGPAAGRASAQWRQRLVREFSRAFGVGPSPDDLIWYGIVNAILAIGASDEMDDRINTKRSMRVTVEDLVKSTIKIFPRPTYS